MQLGPSQGRWSVPARAQLAPAPLFSALLPTLEVGDDLHILTSPPTMLPLFYKHCGLVDPFSHTQGSAPGFPPAKGRAGPLQSLAELCKPPSGSPEPSQGSGNEEELRKAPRRPRFQSHRWALPASLQLSWGEARCGEKQLSVWVTRNADSDGSPGWGSGVTDSWEEHPQMRK